MGSFYDRPFATWSRGDYPYATQPAQDDLAIVGETLPAAPLQGGATDAESAEALAPPPDATAPTSVAGVFSSRKQQRFFRFKAGTEGTATVSLAVAPTGPGSGAVRTLLAAQLRVWRGDTGADVGGGPVANAGTGGVSTLDGATVVSLAVGVAEGVTYFVEISAARSGDAGTGFTEYSSQGTFALSLRQSAAGVVVAAAGPPPNSSSSARCSGLALRQLTRAAGNCESGWAVRAEDVLAEAAAADLVVSITPSLGTVVAGGASQVFVVALPGGGAGASCSTRVSAAPCAPLGQLTITCLPPQIPYATLAAPGCDTAAVRPEDFYRVWRGDEQVPYSDAPVTFEPLLKGNKLPAGVFTVRATLPPGTQADSPRCFSQITIEPCVPVPAPQGPGLEIALDNTPGTCAASPRPAAVFLPETVSFSGVVRARARPTGPLIPLPLKSGKYFFELVYPGADFNPAGVVVAPAVPRPVTILVLDAEAPTAQLKPTVARDAGGGFICAKGASRGARSACVSLASLLSVADNCAPTGSGLKRKFTCQGAGCATVKPKATKLCVEGLRAGKGRVEATYTLTVSDKAGNKSPPLAIPIAAYHFKDAAPTGAKCYTA